MPIFVHRFFTYTPSKPHHPLLRLALGLVGLVVLAFLVVAGLFVGLGMLMFAAARRMVRGNRVAAAPQPQVEGVIEGEYSVVSKHEATLSLR